MIIAWVDASYHERSKTFTWGAKVRTADDEYSLSGHGENIQTSTHAEILAVYECLVRLSQSHPEEIFEVRTDCKSVVNLWNGDKAKDLAIGRVLVKLQTLFSENLKITHIHGHCPNEDKSLDSVRNREAHSIAYNLNKSKKAA